jgi:hypothetical protein
MYKIPEGANRDAPARGSDPEVFGALGRSGGLPKVGETDPFHTSLREDSLQVCMPSQASLTKVNPS